MDISSVMRETPAWPTVQHPGHSPSTQDSRIRHNRAILHKTWTAAIATWDIRIHVWDTRLKNTLPISRQGCSPCRASSAQFMHTMCPIPTKRPRGKLSRPGTIPDASHAQSPNRQGVLQSYIMVPTNHQFAAAHLCLNSTIARRPSFAIRKIHRIYAWNCMNLCLIQATARPFWHLVIRVYLANRQCGQHQRMFCCHKRAVFWQHIFEQIGVKRPSIRTLKRQAH